ncbi:hypothetical protein JTB14_000223 [Gonioctena quinquepunctata]|nr:hypothetical protein JTB14_000223 [Gonioctena quinquepunctata]
MCIRIQAFFGGSYEASIHTLQQKFHANSAKLESSMRELKSCSGEIYDNMLMNKILMTLPDNFKHSDSAWGSTAEKSLNVSTTSLIIGEERISSRIQNKNYAAGALAAEQTILKRNRK